MSYSQTNNLQGGFSQLNVVAVEPDTKINITPRHNGILQNKFTITLDNIGDVYQYQSSSDITGSLLEVDSLTSNCKRFAAFSGSSGLDIVPNGCTPFFSQNNRYTQTSYDPLLQQLYSIESLGTIFPLIPFANRNRGSIFRVLASQNNTIIKIDGVTRTLNTGEFYTTEPIYRTSLITTSKPASVAQFALSQTCADSGNGTKLAVFSDPDMVLLNPLEYSIKNVTLYSSTLLDISDQFLNVMIPVVGVASFKINNLSFSGSFSAVPGAPNFQFAQIDLTKIGGSNFFLTADVGFNAMAYGFGDAESYAYSAGTNLAATTFINAVRPVTNEIIQNACRDENFDYQLTLPYISQKLIWKLDAADTSVTQLNAAYTEVIINGKTLFQYKLPINKAYGTTGIKNIKITSTLPNSQGGCTTGDEEIILELEVYDPPPLTRFTSLDSSCIGIPVKYNLEEVASSRPVVSYLWDFGDGTTSTEKNPTHTFTTDGEKIVSLIVKNDVACVSNIFRQPIVIYKEPAANFTLSDDACTNQPLNLLDASFTDGRAITSFSWDFGDGGKSTDRNPTHIFIKAGNYQVRFVIVTETNCTAETIKSITVVPAPTVTFNNPESCVDDFVQFNALASEDVVAYDWDFGDPSTGANNVSGSKNPQHRFSRPANYIIKVSATSANGCITIFQKQVTISAGNPTTSFSVINPTSLCSNQSVQFKDLSFASFGSIVRLEWIFDNTAAPNNVNVISGPQSQATYTHKYPQSKDDKVYQVVLKAFSGASCFNIFMINITVKGSPLVVFNRLRGVCVNEPAFKLTQASETLGISGNGVYSGSGVSEDGFFSPQTTGPGNHIIRYSYFAINGCSDVKQQTITVSPLPTVNAGTTKTILLGGEVTLNPVLTGDNISVKWTPSTGLDNDQSLIPKASPSTNTTYFITVTTANGCTAKDSVTVLVKENPEVPNTFTPNGDGINDTWNIKSLDTYVNGTVQIFNRYGQEVFISVGYPNPWDGRSKGIDVPFGVYYYIINSRTGRNRFSGSVTVIR